MATLNERARRTKALIIEFIEGQESAQIAPSDEKQILEFVERFARQELLAAAEIAERANTKAGLISPDEIAESIRKLAE